jgi:hypothetical protein
MDADSVRRKRGRGEEEELPGMWVLDVWVTRTF